LLAPGDHAVVVDMGFAKVGLSVCYDLRFPELYSYLAGQLEADILLVPAAFTVLTGQAHWETLLRARAIENQCVVVAPSQCGIVLQSNFIFLN
jgi:predicted amidohydrolase